MSSAGQLCTFPKLTGQEKGCLSAGHGYKAHHDVEPAGRQGFWQLTPYFDVRLQCAMAPGLPQCSASKLALACGCRSASRTIGAAHGLTACGGTGGSSGLEFVTWGPRSYTPVEEQSNARAARLGKMETPACCQLEARFEAHGQAAFTSGVSCVRITATESASYGHPAAHHIRDLPT